MDADSIIWLIGGLCVFFTAVGGLMSLSSDYDSKKAGQKILIGWWSAFATVAALTLLMTFVVKPAVNWFLRLF